MEPLPSQCKVLLLCPQIFIFQSVQLYIPISMGLQEV